MSTLELMGVCKRFGGNEVLSGIDLVLKRGEKVGIIGPNGAGKSTLFNTVSGQLPLSAGSIRLADREISALPPHRRVWLGLGRSFQLTSLLAGLTVIQNLLLALQGTGTRRYRLFRDFPGEPRQLEIAAEMLQSVGLWEKRKDGVGALSYGEQKQLEILLALSVRPSVLLLDEPAAGLAPSEVRSLTKLLANLSGELTLAFTEHDMDVVFELADRIVVLFNGRIIAEGTPDEIRRHDTVRDIYLGTEQVRHADA